MAEAKSVDPSKPEIAWVRDWAQGSLFSEEFLVLDMACATLTSNRLICFEPCFVMLPVTSRFAD